MPAPSERLRGPDTASAAVTLYALVQRFAVAGITALLLLEDVTHGPIAGGSPVASEFGRLSYMCDNLLLLESRRGEHLSSAHDEGVHPLTITAQGVHVG